MEEEMGGRSRDRRMIGNRLLWALSRLGDVKPLEAKSRPIVGFEFG